MSVSDSMVSSGLGAGHSLTSGRTPTRLYGWTWRWRAGRVKNSEIPTSLQRARSSEEILQSCSRRAAVGFRQITSDVRPTEVATCTDAGGGGGL